MKVGIICAVDRELAPFLHMINNSVTTEKAMLKFYSGEIDDVTVVTMFCGVCKTNAAIASQILIDTYSCDIIINAGTAGGMDIKVKLYDTIFSTEIAHHDVEAGILTEFHPWMDSIYFKADEALIQLSKNLIGKNNIPNVHFGRMITGEFFVTDDFRAELNNEFAPLSIDMETASIAHACFVNKIPFIAIRTITDTEEHAGTNNFELNCEKASKKSADLVRLLLSEIHNHYPL